MVNKNIAFSILQLPIGEIDVEAGIIHDMGEWKDFPTGINTCLEWANENLNLIEEALPSSTLHVIVNDDAFGFIALSEGSPVINQYSNRATWLNRAGALECWK